MLWEQERYVRVYKRDTADWLALSWDAQGLLMQLLRKVDLAGRLDLGRHGLKAVAIVLQRLELWESRLKPALEELLADGCVAIQDNHLIFPNYVPAQTAVASTLLRKRTQRERDELSRNVTSPKVEQYESRNVTEGHETGPNVTPGHDPSRDVTPAGPAKPAEPSGPAKPVSPRASAPADTPPSPVADPWPKGLLEQLRPAMGFPNDLDAGWQKFVRDSLEFPSAQRAAAARKFLASGVRPDLPASYVLALIRKGVGQDDPRAPKPLVGQASSRELHMQDLIEDQQRGRRP